MRNNDVDKRWHSRVVINGPDDCWLWQGAPGPNGYGRIRDHNEWLVHRWTYQRFVGPIPPGLLVMHNCDVKMCVNPTHLTVGTHSDNSWDSINKGRFTVRNIALKRSQQTHCKYGHLYSKENTGISSKDGSRSCRRCNVISTQRSQVKKRAMI